MDKDKSQLNQHGALHIEKASSDSALCHVSNGQDQEQLDQEAEMDAQEARLFAMARSHS